MTQTVTQPALLDTPFPEPRLRVLDGRTELAAATAAASAETRPEAVTALLAALLESVGGAPATPEAIRALPCASREWLVQWSAAQLRGDLRWFEVACSHCGTLFDLSLDLGQPICEPPRSPAQRVTVSTSRGERSFKVPTGAEEERFARTAPAPDPRRTLARLCAEPEDTDEADLFTEHDLELIDEAMEAASPDIADTLFTPCPACGAETAARIDPLRFAFPREGDLLERLHRLARGYGWSLAEILSLPSRHLAWFAERLALDTRSREGAR